ncbi:NmrA domain-containing protein [Mycena sanguinolenta]|uniref:NmrA domain-containing protein n=1 Tax=Mycena sanguinolenta TaxID=230812 RepID=A0A8H7DF74_9AGAR|nr:NmrA domain-containing protein [Mycena sanguinolenta]
MTITQSESAPLVAVVGSTGIQGGSVIKALSESDKPYRIRGFTRDPTKATAEKLRKSGVEMVAIDLVLENKEDVSKAFAGADYVFLVTNFWEHMDWERELSEGKMLVDAAKAASVKGIIWSGLAHAKKISGGKYSLVGHFDSKAQVTEYGRASGVPFVDVQAGFYASNFLGNFPLIVKEPDGTYCSISFNSDFDPSARARLSSASSAKTKIAPYVLPWPVRPTTVVPLIDMDNDYGLYVRRVLELPVFPDGSVVCTTSEDIAVGEITHQLSQVSGKKIVFKQITAEDATKNFIASGIPPAITADLVEGMQFHDEFGYYGGRATTREGLAQPTRTFTEFAKGVDWNKILV